MSEQKTHIDDSFIPEGLEFREEYMHAALGNYRRQKRVILWMKMGVAALILLAISSVSIILWNQSNTNQQALKDQSNSIIEQEKIQTDSSSSNDLDDDEGTFTQNRQSPAVESSEATQDLSTKAVDMGDPMSSGVGLPGQLSTISPKITSADKREKKYKAESPSIEKTSVKGTIVSESQDLAISGSEEQQVERIQTPSALAFIGCNGLNTDIELAHGKPIPAMPLRKWSFHAALGVKLWADYSFGREARKIDPILSLGAEYKWRKKMGLFANAQFFTVSGVAQPYVATQRQYNEGYRETTFSYHTDRFFYAGVSVGANYRITKKHSIGLLYDFNYLLTADNRITTGNSSSFETATSSQQKARGYVNGFEPIQQSVGFVYEFALGKNKSIGATYRQGLSDVTINDYFGNDIHRNSLLAVHLKVKLK
jgi:hypothetical protein